MYSNTHKIVEIDLKDLFFVMLKRTSIVIIVGIVFAGIMFAYKYLSSANDANILDTTVRLDGETDVAYAERVQNVGRAEDMIHSIDVLNEQVEKQRQYVTDSVLMRIDAENEAVTTASIVVTVDSNLAAGIDNALVSSYSQDIKTGEYLTDLSEEFATKQGYLTELIDVKYSDNDSVIFDTNDNSGSVGTITITVIGPNLDYTNRIMEVILEELDAKHLELNETMIPHTIVTTGVQSYFKVDNDTRDTQFNAINRFEVLQKQIETIDKSLGDLASKIGVKDKESLYVYFSFNSNQEAQSANNVGSAVKYAIIGFLAGAIIVALMVALDYIFDRRFSTQTKFFAHFPQVYKVGVAKPTYKRSRLAVLIDRKTGDDNMLSLENSRKLMSANIGNLTAGMNKVLFTGTADAAKTKELINELNINADVKDSIFADPSVLGDASKYDGVILIEQRNHSDCTVVAEELKLLSNADTKIIGAIVI